MFNSFVESTEGVLEESLQKPMWLVVQNFENDTRGVELKNVYTKLDELSSRIANTIATEQDPDTRSKLAALKLSLIVAREVVPIIWSAKQN